MRIPLALFTASAASITTGTWLFSPAAALIVLGVLLAVLGVLLIDDGRKT